MAKKLPRDFVTQISTRAFQLHKQDIENLRNLYRRQQLHVSRQFVYHLSRKQLVDSLLTNEFSRDALKKYQELCNQWDEARAFVEGT